MLEWLKKKRLTQLKIHLAAYQAQWDDLLMQERQTGHVYGTFRSSLALKIGEVKERIRLLESGDA